MHGILVSNRSRTVSNLALSWHWRFSTKLVKDLKAWRPLLLEKLHAMHWSAEFALQTVFVHMMQADYQHAQ